MKEVSEKVGLVVGCDPVMVGMTEDVKNCVPVGALDVKVEIIGYIAIGDDVNTVLLFADDTNSVAVGAVLAAVFVILFELETRSRSWFLLEKKGKELRCALKMKNDE